MSVTFAPEFRNTDISGWALRCNCGTSTAPARAATYAEAEAWVNAGLLPACGDDYCAALPASIAAEHTTEYATAPTLNVSNINGRFMLDALGYGGDDDLCGTREALDVMGAVLLALAVSPVDPGRPATQDGKVIDCGRAPAYLQDRLNDLHDVAAWAAAQGRAVTWS